MSQPVPLTLDGGLQLEDSKPQAQAGTLLECLNYERTLRKGYSRIEGFERFDGQPTVSDVQFWRLTSSDVTGTPAVGMAVYFSPQEVGYILSLSTSGTVTTIDVVFHGGHTAATVPDTLTGTGGASAEIDSLTVIATPGGTVGTLNTALNSLATLQRSEIGEVPGRTGSDVIHTFWLKNRCYAIRDLCRVPFTDGYYTDSDEGKFVTIGPSEFEILDVRLTGDNSGILTINCDAGSGTNAEPIGPPTLGNMSLSGSFDNGAVGQAYSDGLTLTGGIAPIVWSIDDGSLPPPIIRHDPDATDAGSATQATNAALYKATDTGWSRVDLGREMAFRAGTANIRDVIMFPMNQQAQDLMMAAPSPVTAKQLRELHIRVVEEG
jgi:hypothetical protein